MRPDFQCILPLLVLSMTIGAGSAPAADLTGRYVGETDAAMTLLLQEAPGGVVTGTLSAEGTVLPVSGRRKEALFSGTVGTEVEGFSFSAQVEGERLIMTLRVAEEVQQLTFKRIAEVKSPAPGGPRKVEINGKSLSGKELEKVEKAYKIHIPDADYWYDPVLGAWGARGGPTMGFILPGLELGGPLPADASGTGTGIFVNGRELHPLDVMALQQVTGPIMPGRYFITANGLAGIEGGPPLWNLLAMMQSPGGASGGGGSNTWQSRLTGASGFSDGTTGAVFLPNGGIVSTGN